jgi:hypothetical protein
MTKETWVPWKSPSFPPPWPAMTGERTTSWAPGRYRFTDYWRFGLPLSLVVLAAAIPMISQVWPAAG